MVEAVFTIALKDDPDVVAEYVAAHRRIWPEVKDAMRAVGIREQKIWLLGTRLFVRIVTDDDFDWERDIARYLELPRTKEWDDFMRTLQVPVPEAGANDWWAPMEKVFDLDWPDPEPDA